MDFKEQVASTSMISKGFDGQKKNELDKYFKHLKWIILSVFFFLILALIKVYFEVPEYRINASILIKEQEKGNSINDLNSFQEFGLMGLSGDESLDNEMEILMSRRLMAKVVDELGLTCRIFRNGFPHNVETFPNSPITITILDESVDQDFLDTNFEIEIISKNKFNLTDHSGTEFENLSFGRPFNCSYGNKKVARVVNIRIDAVENLIADYIDDKLTVYYGPKEYLVTEYLDLLNIEPVDKMFSKIIKISIDEPSIDLGLAIVNNLIEQYNADAINERSNENQSTTDFLDERLLLLSSELEAIETSAQQFRSKNRMLNSSNNNAEIVLQSSSANENELISVNTELKLIDYMLDHVRNNGKNDLLPSNVGLSQNSIVGSIVEYNNLILRRNRILKSSSDLNPIVVNIDSQLEVIKDNLIESLESEKRLVEIQLSSLNNQSYKINSRIENVPKNEQEYQEIVRHKETKNALYLFLLQKREESILSDAVTVTKAKIIDHAYTDGVPVSPIVILNFMSFFFVGLFLPVGFIYFKDVLDNKIRDEEDVRELGIPYIGDIPTIRKSNNEFILQNDNSENAEAFRFVRTNISFMLNEEKMGNTIFVTSTISGEGKTFSAINLASSLAISGKKTVLVGLDLRAPKFMDYLNLEKVQGVTNYVKNKNLEIKDLVLRINDFEHLDIIASGDIPPNPVEMLMSSRVVEMFEQLKSDYEYVIVDTAPVGLVTDTVQVSKFADLTIYVMKSGYLDKRMLHIPAKMFGEAKLKNMALLINGIDTSKKGYGYGYGYGAVDSKKKKWYNNYF